MTADSGIKPSPIALVVCDNVYVEEGGKSALIGLFNRISARSFPTTHPKLAVFVSVTGVRPGMEGHLDIVHSETDEPVVQTKGSFGDDIGPTDIVDMTFMLRNLRFDEPGTYFIRFFGNEHPLMMRPFEVTRIPNSGGSDDNS